MAEPGVYDFQAPQFIESLSEVKLEDGADTFFDAEDSATENGISRTDLNDFVEAGKAVPDEKKNSKAKVSNTKGQQKKGGIDSSLRDNDENQNPDTSNSRPMTRLQRMSVKPNGTQDLKNQSKFLSVAEQLHKFHHSTPPRFKRKSAIFKSKNSKFLPTVAHSPQLRTKIRAARPSTVPVPESVQKPVIIPIKKKVLTRGVAIKPIPKPPTIPVPFNLTMSSNKKQEESKSENVKDASKEKKPTFAAPKALMRKALPVKKKCLEIQDNKLTVKESFGVTGIKTIEKPNSTTKTVPFSFEKRNQERLLEKQKKIEEAKEQQNKMAIVTPRKSTRPSTASVAGSAKQTKKVKNEDDNADKPVRSLRGSLMPKN